MAVKKENANQKAASKAREREVSQRTGIASALFNDSTTFPCRHDLITRSKTPSLILELLLRENLWQTNLASVGRRSSAREALAQTHPHDDTLILLSPNRASRVHDSSSSSEPHGVGENSELEVGQGANALLSFLLWCGGDQVIESRGDTGTGCLVKRKCQWIGGEGERRWRRDEQHEGSTRMCETFLNLMS